jgi:hypothetical protein
MQTFPELATRPIYRLAASTPPGAKSVEDRAGPVLNWRNNEAPRNCWAWPN